MGVVEPRGTGRIRAIGAVAAFACAALLGTGIAALVVRIGGLRLWLAVLWGINASIGGVVMASLEAVNPIDVAVLLAGALAFSGFWPGPGRPHRRWMGLAIALPLVGIAVLFATGLAGRSGLMGGGLVLGSLMLGRRDLRPLGSLGIVANAALLIGDFGTVGPSALGAWIVGVGYMLLVVWFGWMGAVLVSGGIPRNT